MAIIIYGITNGITGGTQMTFLLVTLGISLGLTAVIARNTDHNCSESKGIALGFVMSTAIWVLMIILVKAWCM